MPMRMLVAFGVALLLTVGLSLYLSPTFIGRAIKAVAQDQTALALMGADPVRIKQWAFGIATATCALAGALLIIVGPVEPGLGRLYIGRTFCVAVLAGLGSMPGTLAAGIILGVAESVVLTSLGRVVGARGGVRDPAAGAGRSPGRTVRPLITVRDWTKFIAGAIALIVAALILHACGPERILLLRRLCGAAVHRAGDRLEHPRRLRGLRELRLGRLLRDRRLHRCRA